MDSCGERRINLNKKTMTKEETNLLVINRLKGKGYDVENMDFTLLNDFVDIIHKEQLSITSVSQQRELLFAMFDLAQTMPSKLSQKDKYKVVDKLIANNCS